jgi:virginiamycin B lyase
MSKYFAQRRKVTSIILFTSLAWLATAQRITAQTAVPLSPLNIIREYSVPAGTGPHDVAPAPDGVVYFTAQRSGELGILDPSTGKTRLIKLGDHSAPHGVIVAPDNAAWITDGGQNAIVRVDPTTFAVKVFPLPTGSKNANLNTATFDQQGILWFTGQAGIYGRLDPKTEIVEVFDAPHGTGPYGIHSAPDGFVYYASLAGSYVGQINPETHEVTVLNPPTPDQGARRIWPDSKGNLWISEWNAGQVGRYDPKTDKWQEWKLPGDNPHAYAVYVDENDQVWLSDWGANAMVRFDPITEKFTSTQLPSAGASVRQILGRKGEVWAAESAVDKLIVIQIASTH